MHDASSTCLDVLVRPPAREPVSPSLEALWGSYRSERAAGRSPFSAAVVVASQVDRLGHAFAVGYPAALEHLVGPIEVPCALCVTEAEGNAPRSIAATLQPVEGEYRLRGTKTFVTFATLAKTLLVACREGDKPDGRPNVAVVRVPADRKGIALHELPAMPFVPEITHARVELSDVAVTQGERLPGDGYLEYVKPFRTIEDIHVVGAALGYALGLARRAGRAADLAAELSACLAALDGVRWGPPLDARVHVVLEGVLRRVQSVLGGERFAAMLQSVPQDERDRWARDRGLLDVASKARKARFERAMEHLGWSPGPVAG